MDRTPTGVARLRNTDLMLLLTETADQAIRKLLAEPDVPQGAGLRVTSEKVTGPDGKERTDLRLSLTQMPADTDQVIEEPRVFVEQATAEMLSAKILDAEFRDGEIQFGLLPQGGAPNAD